MGAANRAVPPAIEAVGVSRAFGKVPVVRDATFSVREGEITALVGPNGSGKTTLMLMLATLLKPDSGKIRIAGHEFATDISAARARLGWMPDTLGSWPTLSVREALTAVCKMYGLRGAHASSRVEDLLARAGLTELADQRTHTLSRGQKQRLSLARALAHRPRVLLLDEPASGLDPEARLAQRRILTDLAAEGVAILVTSHVLDELDQLAHNVVFLRDGRTETPAAVTAALSQGKLWRVRSLDPERLEGALTALEAPWERSSSLSGDIHTVGWADDDRSAAELLRALIDAGVPVVEFAPSSSALERAFVRLSTSEEATP